MNAVQTIFFLNIPIGNRIKVVSYAQTEASRMPSGLKNMRKAGDILNAKCQLVVRLLAVKQWLTPQALIRRRRHRRWGKKKKEDKYVV